MNRRNALRNISLATGSLISIPAWMVSCGISDSNTHRSGFTSQQQQLLASVADTIIPAGTSVGALSVETDKYLQKIIDDCYEKPVQDNVKKQLKTLNENAHQSHGKSFADCSQSQREELLLAFVNSATKEEQDFFSLMKSETIKVFTTSQKVMEDFLGYKIAPGHYYGCVQV